MKEKKSVSGNLFDLKILHRLYQYVLPYKFYFYLLVFLTIFAALLSPLIPMIVGRTIDKHIRTFDVNGLTFSVGLLVGILILQAFVSYVNTYLADWLGQNVIRDIRVQLYQHLLKFRLRFFDRTPIGQLVTRNISDIETLANVFSEGLASIVGDILQLIVILTVMFWINWKLTLYSLCTLPILLISTYVFKEKIKDSFNLVRTAVASLNTFVQEHITGMLIVQMFNSEKREYKKFEAINEEHKKANLKSVLYYSVYFPVAEVIAATGTGLLLWFGSHGVLEGTVSSGNLISFIMYIAMFFRPIRMIADRFNTLQLAIVSSDRIFKLLDNTEDIPANGNLPVHTIHGAVKFDNVWFAYNQEDYVLKNISFDVKAGQSVALVGATGAGKSSVINLLSRFYEINKGEIKIDGVDIREYDVAQLRHHIGVVLQDVFLFSDTIANNITLNNPDISREKIWEAAQLIGAEKFISKLPGGLDYNVMERGATLSVGQRQIISFLRTLVYDPKIIVLDEATSSIDTETEELIQHALGKMMQGRTSVIIAHRLSTIQKCDKIFVLEKGEIKESGRHDELINQNGLYAQLNKMQQRNII